MTCTGRCPILQNIFQKRDHLVIHTGNINNWGELKMQGFSNSAEELLQCIKLQLNGWKPSENQLKEKNKLFICENDHCEVSLGDNDRKELKITIKIFMTQLDVIQIDKCLNCVLDELGTDFVEQLIVSFPQIDDDELEAETDEAQAQNWLEKIKPVWNRLEQLVSNKKAFTIGVADLELPELKALYDWAPDVKPAIDHYNIVGCCTVPPELQAYAKANDVQLLTHNDPTPFPGDNKFREICVNNLGLTPDCCKEWDTVWCARYTVMIRRRSVINAKGYVVRFEQTFK